MNKHYIREWRKFRGLTQANVALEMGISASYFTMIEKGHRRYDQKFLEAAARVLDCSMTDLIANPPGQWESIDAMIAELPEADRVRLASMVKAMIQSVRNGG